jgi:4,5-dihydroxyphthalate decarboxylase
MKRTVIGLSAGLHPTRMVYKHAASPKKFDAKGGPFMTKRTFGNSGPSKPMSRRNWLYTAVGAGAVLTGLPRTGYLHGVAEAAGMTPAAGTIPLSMCLSDNPRTRPLRDGRVKADGIDLAVSTAHPSEMFWRQLHFAEFEISEMSMSSLLMAIANGDKRWVALPVFTSREFFHTRIMVRTDRGINKPEDLKGKRVAVPEYQQTSALWARGVLQHEFGVTAFDMDWYMERTEEMSHAGATGFQPPKGLKFQHIPANENIGQWLVEGKVDATLLYLNEVNLIDRSTYDISKDPNIRLLFPDIQAEGVRYYKKTDMYPVNHCVVIQRQTVEKNPWIVLNIFKAFEEARNLVNTQTREGAAMYFDLDLLPSDRRGVLNTDPYQYGAKANRRMLESLMQYSFEQGLTPRKLTLEEVFHPATLGL